MAVVNVLAFGLLVLSLSLYWKEEIVDVLPVAACLLVLFLYPLAFVRRLSGVDIAGVLFLLLMTGWFLRQGKEKRRLLCREAASRLAHPGVWAAVLVFAGTAFLVRGRVALWWDDVNFWATDAKAIYLLDGFASKYTNAAPEFGDYPPGLQLLKWWFLHLSPGHFSEGLMFAGYYFGVFVFLMPLLRRLRGGGPVRTLLIALAGAWGIWAFPSVAEVFYCQGMCADLVMAALYGAFLSAAADEAEHRRGFDSLRLSLYLAVLVLVKSVGFLWAAFGIVFWCGYRLAAGRRRPWKQAGILLLPLCTGAGWMAYCLRMRRVARLTGAAVSVAAGHLPILLEETRAQLLYAFGEAFVFWPLHRERTWTLDFSPLLMLLFLWGLAALLWRTGLVSRRIGRFLFCFLPLEGIVFYGIDLVSHLTVFAAETQYLDPYAMVSSMERYGAPFTVGTMYLLAFLLLERAAGSRGREKAGGTAAGARAGRRLPGPVGCVYLALFLFVTACADWPQVFWALSGYWEEREETLQTRADMVAAARPFLDMLEDMRPPDMRVVCVRDAEQNAWVNNAYTAYEASPVSLVFVGVDASYMGREEAAYLIASSHAGYLYADPMEAENAALLDGMTDALSPGVLYRIETEGGALRLTRTGIRAQLPGAE